MALAHPHPLIWRRDAAQATLDHFNGRPFAWGEADCVRLAAWHVRRMGHKTKLAKAGAYHDEAGARKALAKAGFRSLQKAVDAHGFARIAPAAALVGDIVALEGEGGWPALCVALGNGRVLGFHEGQARVLKPLLPVLAWRVEPCLKR
jgi:hypothetical protein